MLKVESKILLKTNTKINAKNDVINQLKLTL
jgi:hypothetical protein